MRPKPLFSVRTEDKGLICYQFIFSSTCYVSDTLQPQINIVPPPGSFLPSKKGAHWAEEAINCNNDKILHKYYSNYACKLLSYSGGLTVRTGT